MMSKELPTCLRVSLILEPGWYVQWQRFDCEQDLAGKAVVICKGRFARGIGSKDAFKRKQTGE